MAPVHCVAHAKNPSGKPACVTTRGNDNCIIGSLSSTPIDKWNCSISDRAARIFSSRTCNGPPRISKCQVCIIDNNVVYRV